MSVLEILLILLGVFALGYVIGALMSAGGAADDWTEAYWAGVKAGKEGKWK